MRQIFLVTIAIVSIFLRIESVHALTKGEKIALAIERLPEYYKNRPCHELDGLQYKNGFPASIVKANDPSGKMTPQEYAGSSFASIAAQRYDPGEKKYILPLYLSDEIEPNTDTGEFVGFLMYHVERIAEPYDAKKHGDFPFAAHGGRVPGSDPVRPLRETVTHTYHVGYGQGSYSENLVIWEKCYAPVGREAEGSYADLWNIYRNDYQGLSWFAKFFFKDPSKFLASPTYAYNEDEVPTILGYWANYSTALDQQMRFQDNAESGLALLSAPFLVPSVIFKIEKAYLVNELGNPLVWVDAGLSAATSTLAAIKLLGGGAVIAKVLPVEAKTANTAVNILLKGSGTTQAIGLGSFYAYKGEYLNALGAVASGSTTVYVGFIKNGKVMVGTLGEVSPNCPIKNIEQNVPVLKVNTNSAAHKVNGVCTQLIEPSNTLQRQQFLHEVAVAQMERPGQFTDATERLVYRVAHRPPNEVAAANGFYPNPNHNPGSIVWQVSAGNPGTSRFVSTTTKEDISILFPHIGIDEYPIANYTPEELRAMFNTPWDPSKPLPAPINYVAWEYRATTLGTEFKPPVPDDKNLFEVVVRAMRLDEMDGARRVDILQRFRTYQSDGQTWLATVPTRETSVQYGPWTSMGICR